MERDYEQYFRQNRLPHMWCPGCGNGTAMKAIVQAIAKKGFTKENTVIVSGIGCSSRASGYMDFDTLHTAHGRALPFATGIKLARHVHINIACTISHDVTIGEFSTLSPGVHVSGHVRIGKSVFIGTGANIINGSASQPLVIGDGAIVAAGACVTRDVEPGSMVAGVPATRRR